MKEKRSFSFISTGVTSMVLIFVMLCLVTFSVLSLVSAESNLRLAQRSAQRTTAYYEAENRANDILIALETAAKELRSEDQISPEDFTREVLTLAGDTGAVLTDAGTVAYQVPLGEDQLLYVELEVRPEPGPEGLYCRIEAWQVVSQYDWAPDETLDLAAPAGRLKEAEQ